MNFELRQHIRDILAETTEENLDTLSTLIFNRTPVKDTREAYRQALTEVVRKELANAPRAPKDSRPDQISLDIQATRIGTGSNTTGEGQTAPDTHTRHTLPGGNIRNSRATRLRLNRFRVSVWIGNKTYRNLLECTAENLAFAAAESEKQSEANAATARKYRRLLKVMAERHVDTVAELADDEIKEALGDE